MEEPFPVGQEIANLVTKYADGAKMTPEVELWKILANCKWRCGVGITNANLAYFAANGMKPYEGKLKSVQYLYYIQVYFTSLQWRILRLTDCRFSKKLLLTG